MKKKSDRVWFLGPVIIGAGPSGLAASACLKEKGVPSLILERENCIASLWKLKTYDRLKLHLPKHFCELPLMGFPENFPTYPSKDQFLAYLESYAEIFSINPMFEQEVKCAKYDSSIKLWRIRTQKSEILCRWMIVATGENADRVLPKIKGSSEFKGRVLHSCEYKNGFDFKGEKVLVVGCGNSGMEVCLDLCNSGVETSISVRDKLHILPREILGRSTFGISTFLSKWLPLRIVDWFLIIFSRVILGDIAKFGLKMPKIGPLELKSTSGRTPVLDVGAVSKIKCGQIKVFPGVGRFTSDGIEFVDGTAEKFDSVIFATGYRSNVPSWLQEKAFFNKLDGYPQKPFPENWKGENGIYSVGFTRRGLLGTSMDAHRVAEDIASRWNSKTKKVHN